MGRFFVLTLNEATEYVRYLAWMNAVPKGKEAPRGKGQTIKESESWLVDLALECGLSTQTGFGPAVISWQEVQAWQGITHRQSIWLAQAIRHLSSVFVSWLDKAADPSCHDPSIENEQDAVVNQLKKFIASRK